MKEVFDKFNIGDIEVEEIDLSELKNLKENMKGLNDIRNQSLITYKVWDIVVVAFLAVLANANDWEGIHNFATERYSWLKSFLKLTGGIPHEDTYKNVVSILDPSELTKICNDFIIKVITPIKDPDIISIDGKVDKSSSREANEIRDKVKPLNILNAYSHNLGICLYQLPIENKFPTAERQVFM